MAIHNIPIGIEANGQRIETDSMGAIAVQADRYWGAQTQRSLEQGLTLREAAVRSGAVTEDDFDRVVDPKALVGSGLAGS
jgi:fumarate hydratase class II